MRYFIFIVISLSLASFFAGCKKLQLTSATAEGAHTFSCMVEGTVFRPDRSGWFGGPPLNAYVTTEGLSIHAFKSGVSNSPGERITIFVSNARSAGTYSLNAGGSYAIYELNYSGAPYYRTNGNYGGSITLTRFDTSAQIYSGTFHFSGQDSTNAKVIHVKNGRFDIKKQ
jgi:hypothetical protein